MVDLPESLCTSCGYLCTGAVCKDGNEISPSEGSLTVCFSCGHLMAFDAELKLRDLTDNEMLEIAGCAELLEIQKIRAEWSAWNLITRRPRNQIPRRSKRK